MFWRANRDFSYEKWIASDEVCLEHETKDFRKSTKTNE